MDCPRPRRLLLRRQEALGALALAGPGDEGESWSSGALPSRRTESPSPRAFRLIWPPRRSAATVVLLVALALGVLPALALASPTDPLWIDGVYDAGDWDDAVLASAFSDGVAGATGPKDLWTSWIVVGTVQLGWPGPPTRFALRPSTAEVLPPPGRAASPRLTAASCSTIAADDWTPSRSSRRRSVIHVLSTKGRHHPRLERPNGRTPGGPHAARLLRPAGAARHPARGADRLLSVHSSPGHDRQPPERVLRVHAIRAAPSPSPEVHRGRDDAVAGNSTGNQYILVSRRSASDSTTQRAEPRHDHGRTHPVHGRTDTSGTATLNQDRQPPDVRRSAPEGAPP